MQLIKDHTLDRLEQELRDDDKLIMNRWLAGELNDSEADKLLNELHTDFPRKLRVACGLSPEPDYSFLNPNKSNE